MGSQTTPDTPDTPNVTRHLPNRVNASVCVSLMLSVSRCPVHPSVVCFLLLLQQAVQKHGQITLRHADLDDVVGTTEFDSGTITLASDLDHQGWRSTLAHELMHLMRGPVPHRHAAVEEAAVQHQTSDLLLPVGPVLAMSGRKWSEDEVHRIAARAAVDPDTVATVLTPDLDQAHAVG